MSIHTGKRPILEDYYNFQKKSSKDPGYEIRNINNGLVHSVRYIYNYLLSFINDGDYVEYDFDDLGLLYLKTRATPSGKPKLVYAREE